MTTFGEGNDRLPKKENRNLIPRRPLVIIIIPYYYYYTHNHIRSSIQNQKSIIHQNNVRFVGRFVSQSIQLATLKSLLGSSL